MLINPQSANRWRSPIQRAPAAPSISPTGPRYRISVTESAMYSITAQDLAAVGANLETITPGDADVDKQRKTDTDLCPWRRRPKFRSNG